MNPTRDPQILNRWLGKSSQATDVLSAKQANLMATVTGVPAGFNNGDPLPPLWHWIYFPFAAPVTALGRDGHSQPGGFLPPVDLPRRMWAGSRFDFIAPLLIGDQAVKTSRIESISLKNGRSGALCFVTVSHLVSVDGQPRLREEHDIVYREDPNPDTPVKKPENAPQDPDWQQTITPDPVTLFRYSALTFNGHRIHYDRLYCREVEGYPDLVVHGPLIGTLLAGLAVKAHPERPLKRFSFRAHNPVFDSAPFSIAGKGSDDNATLWASTPDGGLAMTAKAEY